MNIQLFLYLCLRHKNRLQMIYCRLNKYIPLSLVKMYLYAQTKRVCLSRRIHIPDHPVKQDCPRRHIDSYILHAYRYKN